MAAAVPMARLSGTLQRARNGIDRKAPPAASTLEMPPITRAGAEQARRDPGSWREGFGFESKNICGEA